jgi:hypothetical protein
MGSWRDEPNGIGKYWDWGLPGMATKDEILRNIGKLMSEDEKAMVVERKCGTCEWYNKIADSCHRYPPQFCVDYDEEGGVSTDANFPWTREDFWCGEWQRRRG